MTTITYHLYQKTDWFGNGKLFLIGDWEFDSLEDARKAIKGLQVHHPHDNYTVIREELTEIPVL